MREIFVELQRSASGGLGGGPPSWLLFAPGALLLAAGIAIWVVPQILVALVAGTLMFLGTFLLLAAWRLHGARRR